MYELLIANKNYSSWSLRPWVLMSGLGIPFREKLIPFPSGPSYSTYKPFSPTGRVPCLLDGAAQVWDSLAIVEYLAERHEGVWPADQQARTWARCAAAEMHSGFSALRNLCGMSCGIRVELAERPATLEADIARIGELWADGLKRFGGPFLAGENFTAVDAFFCPVAFRQQTYGLSFGAAADAYAQRLRDLPAMRDWYAAALAESWREAAHEAETLGAGRLVEDLRAG